MFELTSRLAGRTDGEETMEKIQRAWARLTALMRQGNSEMFESKSITRERIQTGDYLNYLKAYWPRLREWLERFESIEDGKFVTVTVTHLTERSSATSFPDALDD